MPLQSTELARREAGKLELRPGPVRVRWRFDDLISSDGHQLRVSAGCSMRALPESAEQQLLQEVFLTNTASVTAERVAAYFHDTLRTAVAGLCQERRGTDLLSSAGNLALLEAMKAAGNRLAFACGLELLPPFEADIESPSLERQRLEAMQRSLAEQRAAGQAQHFGRAADLLRQFEEMRRTAPQLSPGDILRQINPADQGPLLQTLLLAGGKQKCTEAVWAVAGPSLIKINPTKSPAALTVIPLPTTLGPLRSVQPVPGSHMLLAGARSGVLHLHPDEPNAAEAYVDPAITSQLGFSRAVLWDNQVWACHSEGGVVAWRLGQTEKPAYALRPADLLGASPRNLQVLDESQLVFSTGNRLIVLARAGDDPSKMVVTPVLPEAPSEIVALLPEERRLIVICANGMVQHRDPATLELMQQHRYGNALLTAALLPWLGSKRLLLATDDGAVLGVGLDDDLVTQYLNPYGGLRALAASADVIVGLSGDRQRIVLWNTWEPKRLAADVYVTAAAKHRAADVDVAT